MRTKTLPCGASFRTTRRESSRFEKRRLSRQAARAITVQIGPPPAIVIEFAAESLVGAQGRHCSHHRPACPLSDGLRTHVEFPKATLLRAVLDFPGFSGHRIILRCRTLENNHAHSVECTKGSPTLRVHQ